MKRSGIYVITNLANSKRYVGQSIDMRSRIAGHFRALRGGYHHNTHLQGAYTKYGPENFEARILENTSIDMLDVRECAWIAHYQSDVDTHGYNIAHGGNSSHSVSLATRHKISIANTGYKFAPDVVARRKATRKANYVITAETRAKLSAYAKSRRATPETRAKLAEAGRKRVWTPEIRAKITAANTGRKATPEARANMSAAQKRRAPPSAETRAKLSAVSKGLKRRAESIAKTAAAHRGIKLRPESIAKRTATRKANLEAKRIQQELENKENHNATT